MWVYVVVAVVEQLQELGLLGRDVKVAIQASTSVSSANGSTSVRRADIAVRRRDGSVLLILEVKKFGMLEVEMQPQPALDASSRAPLRQLL